MHQTIESKNANENLPVAKIKGFEVSKRNDIAGNDDPQKKTVENIANIGTMFFINYTKKIFYFLGRDNLPKTLYLDNKFLIKPFFIFFLTKLFTKFSASIFPGLIPIH